MPRKSPKYNAVQQAQPVKASFQPKDRDPRLSKDPEQIEKLRRSGAPSRAKAQSTNLPDPFADREAAKYAQPIVSREAILGFLSASPQLLTIEAIALHFQISLERDLDHITKTALAVFGGKCLVRDQVVAYRQHR